MINDDWLGLTIGNSRLHWAWFQGKKLSNSWESEHLLENVIDEELLKDILPSFLSDRAANLPIYIASVVDSQTALWQSYHHANLITLDWIPLKAIYSGLGIDRALAVWGAGMTYGFPCLVVDAGTALTFTGAKCDRTLVGGAILPGLQLQLRSLATKTAALPQVNLPEVLPERWSLNTSGAIQSGIIYTVLAGIQDFLTDWLKRFPESQIVLTGGDAKLLLNYLKIRSSDLSKSIIIDAHLIFLGMRSLVFSRQELQS